MHTLTFSDNKRTLAVFHAETLNFAREEAGLLITALGEMTQQDTPLLENYLNRAAECHVHLAEGEAEILSARFTVTFFTLEQNQIAVQLA